MKIRLRGLSDDRPPYREKGREKLNTEILLKQAQLECLVTQREGMIAENLARTHRGEAPAYVEYSFAIIASQINALAESLR